MATVRELPDLVREFIDLSKVYLRQETVDSGKQLGHFAGFSLGAAVAFSLAALLGAIAGLRYIRDALPESEIWSAVGYLVWALSIAVIVLVIAKMTSRRISERH